MFPIDVRRPRFSRTHLRVSPHTFDKAIEKGQLEYCSYSGKRWKRGEELVLRMRCTELSIEAVCLDHYYDRDGFCITVIGVIPGAVKNLKEDNE